MCSRIERFCRVVYFLTCSLPRKRFLPFSRRASEGARLGCVYFFTRSPVCSLGVHFFGNACYAVWLTCNFSSFIVNTKNVRYCLRVLVLYQGTKEFVADGAPTQGRRRFFQTSANPIPHPDSTSLKKSATANRLSHRFMWINIGRPTNRATPQVPEEEVGVKKSSTAERPVERRSGLISTQDSIEAILNFKTHPNMEETRVTEEGHLVSRVLHDHDKLNMLYGKGTSTSKKLVIPDYESAIVIRRDQTSRNPIPRPQTDSSEGKRGLVLTGDTTNILRRKTLLYSEPSYRPSGGTSTGKEVNTDPRQLISILGDPLPYKKSDISYHEASSTGKKVHGSAKRRGNESRGRHTKGAHREERFMDSENSDRDMQDVDAFFSRDLDEELSRRDPGEHSMLEHLLDDYSPSFGTRDEKMEKESTIKQIEKLTQQSLTSKDYDFTGLPSEFANMEVSEGELPSYAQIGDTGLNIRRSKVSKNAHKKHEHKVAVLSSKRLRVKTGPDYNKAFSSSQPRALKTKRSLPYHHRHHHHYRHRWRSPYLHIRSPENSPYSDYPDEQEQQDYEDMPKLSSVMQFHRLPMAQRWPTFPISLMAERFVRFSRLPKISEFSPEPLERLEHLPPPPPIPPTIIDREKAGDREAEPVDEWAPFPEPIPEPEPPPIPELPFIKEIPPIAEPQEPAPENLDPKKTFDTGESNGGVKKSSSR